MQTELHCMIIIHDSQARIINMSGFCGWKLSGKGRREIKSPSMTHPVSPYQKDCQSHYETGFIAPYSIFGVFPGNFFIWMVKPLSPHLHIFLLSRLSYNQPSYHPTSHRTWNHLSFCLWCILYMVVPIPSFRRVNAVFSLVDSWDQIQWLKMTKMT